MPVDNYPVCITWEIHKQCVEEKKLLPTSPFSAEQCSMTFSMSCFTNVYQ